MVISVVIRAVCSLESPMCALYLNKIHYKNTSNLRRKYRREKSIFPTEEWISAGNSDGKWVVGNCIVGKKNLTDSDEIRPLEHPSDRLTLSGHTAGFPTGSPME